jgi:hypothetical protein
MMRPCRPSPSKLSLIALLALSAAGCSSAPERPAASSRGCAEAVVAALPAGLTDTEQHCLASAGITQRCSRIEAWAAGWGKEIQDSLGAGDPSRRDLAANRRGRGCAAAGRTTDELLACCRGLSSGAP